MTPIDYFLLGALGMCVVIALTVYVRLGSNNEYVGSSQWDDYVDPNDPHFIASIDR